MSLAAKACPYPGLRSFEYDEAHLFFGRDDEIKDVLSRLKEHRFLAVIGPSGCGKSSLVKAGVLPAIHSYRFPEVYRWHLAVVKPQGQPFVGLAEALSKTDLFPVSADGLGPIASYCSNTLAVASPGLPTRVFLPAADRLGPSQSATEFPSLGPREQLLLLDDKRLLRADESGRVEVVTFDSESLGQIGFSSGVLYWNRGHSKVVGVLENGSVVALDLESLSSSEFDLGLGDVECAALEGDHLLVGNFEGEVTLLDLSRRQPEVALRQQLGGSVVSVVFGANGIRVAATDEGTIVIWPDSSSEHISIPLGHPVELVTSTRDSSLVVASSRSGFSIIKLGESGAEVEYTTTVGLSTVCVLSSDRILCAPITGGLRVWSRSESSWVSSPWLLRPETAKVSSILNSDCGGGPVCVCDDGAVRAWSEELARPLWSSHGKRSRTQRVLESILRQGRDGLIEALQSVEWDPRDRLLIFVDQFEELFTMPGAPGDTESFISMLLEPLEHDLPISILMTMRTDYLGECHQFPSLPRVLSDSQFLVPRMNRAQFRKASREPLIREHVDFDDRLLVKVVNTHYRGFELATSSDPTSHFDQLPLMQHLMATIWRRAQETGADELHPRLYEDVKGAHALNKQLNDVARELPRGTVKRVFQALTGTDGGRLVRQHTSFEELCSWTGPEEEVRAVVDHFREPALSVLMPPPSQALESKTIIDISHEAVIRNWKRLRDDWAGEEEESISNLKSILEYLRERDRWEWIPEPDARTLKKWILDREPELAWACKYLKTWGVGNTDPERELIFQRGMEFVNDSVRHWQAVRDDALKREETLAREAVRSQYKNAGLGLLALLVLLAIALALFAYREGLNAKDSARTGHAYRLMFRANENVATDHQLALMLGATGLALAQTSTDTADSDDKQLEEDLWRLIASAPNMWSREISEPNGFLCVASNGKFIATSSYDNSIRLWNLGELEGQPRDLVGHSDIVTSLSLTDDGRFLASASLDNTIRLWDLATPGKAPRVLTTKGVIWNGQAGVLEVSDKYLAWCGPEDLDITLWDLVQPEKEPETLPGHTDPVTSLAFGSNGTVLASGAKDGMIRLWDPTRPEKKPSLLKGHTGTVASVAFSPDGSALVSGSHDTMVRIWDTSNPDKASLVLKGHNRQVQSVAFSSDGSLLASSSDGSELREGSNSSTVRLWNRAGDELQVFRNAEGGRVIDVGFGTNDLIVEANEYSVRLWSVGQLKKQPLFFNTQDRFVSSLAFSPDGSALASGTDHAVKVWEPDRARKAPVTFSQLRGGAIVAYGADGGLKASTVSEGQIEIWDLSKPDPELRLRDDFTDWLFGFAFSADGDILAIGSGRENIVKVWDLTQAQLETRVFGRMEETLFTMELSSDGTTLVVGSNDGRIRLWDLTQPGEEPKLVLRGHNDRITCIALESSNDLLASASVDGSIRLWNLRDPGSEPRIFTGQGRSVDCVALSPDGRLLASGSADNRVRLWDLKTPMKEPLSLEGQGAAIASLAFSPDSRTLASGSFDGWIVVWNTRDYLPVPTLRTELLERAYKLIGPRQFENHEIKRYRLKDIPGLMESERLPFFPD